MWIPALAWSQGSNKQCFTVIQGWDHASWSLWMFAPSIFNFSALFVWALLYAKAQLCLYHVPFSWPSYWCNCPFPHFSCGSQAFQAILLDGQHLTEGYFTWRGSSEALVQYSSFPDALSNQDIHQSTLCWDGEETIFFYQHLSRETHCK